MSDTRVCPVCRNTVPPGCVPPFTNGFQCPHCQARLEVASGSRILPSWAGLAAGWAIYELAKNSGGALNFVLPELYAVLVFGGVSALVLMFTARLNVVPEAPAAAPAAAPAHGHH